jgi:cytochrome c oxidase assembly factor CtaG
MAPLTGTVPPAPTALSLLADWRVDPVLVLFAAGCAATYLAGVRRVGRAGGRWPRRRVVGFAVGLASLAWTSMGWPAVYGPVLFSVYATQLIVMLTVVPFLLAMGRPLELARTALRPTGLARLDAVLSSRVGRAFTVPVVSPLLLAVVPFVVFFTGVYPASLANPGLLWLLHLGLVVIGLVVLVPLWESDAVAARVAYPVALLFAFIELLADAVPGIVIRLNTHVIAAGYLSGLGRSWGNSLLRDQQIGGDLLWCIGEAVDVPFLALLLFAWVRSDARDAVRIDDALDLGAAPGRAAIEPAEIGSPWWETDASVFGDRAGQFQRPD